jgi:hypothetical protein
MDKFEKEFLDKLKEANRTANFFTIKLEYNGTVVLAKRDFSADKFTPETIQKTRLQFLITDFSRKIQEELAKSASDYGNEQKA